MVNSIGIVMKKWRMIKTDALKSKNNAQDESKDVLDFVLWKENLNKEISQFWDSFTDRDKRVFAQCLFSLWLFTFITNTMVNLGILG